ncbi:AAA family ATPase [Ignavibacterium album]|uniref:AAA family ATPase n=1 Tax=Ignavibacterium album TaxID=591197 RepID=UPI0035B841EC
MITGQLKRVIELQSVQSNSKKNRNNICAVVSGKGGTGKTVFSIYLSDFLAKKGNKILLIDLDINLANIHFLLNEAPEKSLNSYFKHNDELKNVISEYSDNLHIIYGLNAYSFKDISFASALNKLLQDILFVSEHYDLVILDLGAGLSEFLLNVLKNSGIKIIVSFPEPTSIMDAYAVIKMYENFDTASEFNLVLNRCMDKAEGIDSFNKLAKAVQSFLKSSVKLLTTISDSKEIKHLIVEQKLLARCDSEEPFMSEFAVAADKIDKYIHLTNINQPHRTSSFGTAKINSKSSFNL